MSLSKNKPWLQAIDDELLREELVASESMDNIQDSFLKLSKETVKLSVNGMLATRYVLSHPGAVAVVAINNSNEVVMERQWRQPLRKAFWEI